MDVHDVFRYAGSVLAVVRAVRTLVLGRLAALDHDVPAQ